MNEARLKLHWIHWTALGALLGMLLAIGLNLFALNTLLSKEVQLRIEILKRLDESR